MSSLIAQIKFPIPDFLATVLVFKLHIFSRDSLVAFDSCQSEKVGYTRIVNLTVAKTDVILIKTVGHVFCQTFQLWRFWLVCLWQLIILLPPAK